MLLSYNNIEYKINEIINEPNKNSNTNNNNNSNVNNNCPINIDKQLIAKKQKLFDKIYESKKEYETSLDKANEFLITYKNKLEKILNSLLFIFLKNIKILIYFWEPLIFKILIVLPIYEL